MVARWEPHVRTVWSIHRNACVNRTSRRRHLQLLKLAFQLGGTLPVRHLVLEVQQPHRMRRQPSQPEFRLKTLLRLSDSSSTHRLGNGKLAT